MIIPVVTPPAGVSAVKRELLFVPFVGMAVYLMGFLFIDRAHSERGRRTLARAAASRSELASTIRPTEIVQNKNIARGPYVYFSLLLARRLRPLCP